MEEETRQKPRKPDYIGAVRIALWNNGEYASLHIGEMKIRLNKNEFKVEEKMKEEETKITMEDI